MGSIALAAGTGYPVPSTFDDDEARHRRQLASCLGGAMAGKLNVTGSLTLTANAANTTLSDVRIGVQTRVLLMPTTANAAGALATTYFTAFGDGTCTVNHANNAQVDKTFSYALIG